MKKSAYYSDLFFTFCLTSFVALFLLRFFGMNALLAIVPALMFGGLCAFLLSIRLRKKQRVFALKKSEEEEKERLFFYLTLAEPSEIQSFLAPKLALLSTSFEKKQDEEECKEFVAPSDALLSEGKCYLPVFLFRELTADDVTAAAKKLKNTPNAILLCDKISDQASKLCEKLSIKTVEGNLLYRILKDADALPEEFPLKLNVPKRISRREVCFAKSNSKRFFKSGALLSVYSFFTPYSVYYISVACVLFLVSALVRIFGYR